MQLTLRPPAKLNLMLRILGRRADGYHRLQTLFQFVELCDELSFTTLKQPGIELGGDLAGVAVEQNLIYRAALVLQSRAAAAAVQNPGLRIHCRKQIPAGAGLGGGSSDAAATLLALNQLWDLGLSLEQLAQIGLQLGADVPVFVTGQAACAQGVGEELTPLADLPEPWYLILRPRCHVETQKVFTHKQLTRNSPAIKVTAFLEHAGQNDCEPVVRKLYPEVAQALDWLSQYRVAVLTGTGACVFASFAEHDQAKALAAQVPQTMQAFVVKGVNRSPVHRQLGLLGSESV